MTLDSQRVNWLGLREGQPWSAELAQRVREAEQVEKAHTRAARLLARRPQSRARIIESLRRAGFDESCSRGATDELASLGAIDDAALARDIIESELARRPAWRALLERKVLNAGVDQETAALAVDASLRDRDPEQDALKLARRRAAALPAGLDESAKARRLIGALTRRGFDAETAEAAARQAIGTADPAV